MIDQLAERVRRLETAESPVIYKYADDNVSDPPTQAEANTAFGGTAAQWRDGWAGIIDDAGAGTDVWLAVSKNDVWHFAKIDTGGGGVIPHDLLSISHPDTSPAAVVRGDLITGQGVVPLWTRLAHPVNPDRLLTCDANDVYWSLYAVVGAAGQTYTFSTTGGTVPTGSDAAGRVTYWTSADTIAGNAGLTYVPTGTLTVTNALTTPSLSLVHPGGFNIIEARELTSGLVCWTLLCSTNMAANTDGGLFRMYDGTGATKVQWDSRNAIDSYVVGTGYIGFGTATPVQKIDVVGTVTTTYIRVASPVGNSCGVLFSDAGADRGLMRYDSSDTLYIYGGGSAAANIRVTMTSAGLFGIGDGLTPSVRLHAMDNTTTANAVLEVARIEARVSTALTGFADGGGVGIAFYAESATDTDYRHAGDVQLQWKVATGVGRQSQVRIWAEYNGTSCPVGVIVAPASAPTVPAFSAWGTGAVDFATYRNTGTQVASGDYATIPGGYRPTASGDYSVALAGCGNAASGECSVAMGGWAVADKYAQVAHANGRIDGGGDVQNSKLQIGRAIATHADTTWYTLYTDNASLLATIAADTAWNFRADIIGLETGATRAWGYTITGVVKNDGGTTTLLASTVTTLYEDDAAYDVQAVADDANDALLIQVRRNGGSDYDIKWSCRLVTAEVTHD